MAKRQRVPHDRHVTEPELTETFMVFIESVCDDCVAAILGIVAGELDNRHTTGAAITFLVEAVREGIAQQTAIEDAAKRQHDLTN